MSKLRKLVDQAAMLSVSANSADTRELAARKQREARAAIAKKLAQLETMERILDLVRWDQEQELHTR